MNAPVPAHSSTLARRSILLGGLGIGAAGLAGCSVISSASENTPSDTITFGISAPRTGPLAEYGKYYDQGFQVALEEINAAGGINGKKLNLVWQDSQSDPKQSVPIAQKFVADSSIVAELGDFSSGASMAATPVYQRAKLVQFGFTNSNPAFTAGGDRAWTTAITQDNYQRAYAKLLKDYGKRVAVLYQQTDWGRTSFDLFSKYAAENGLSVVDSSAFNPETQDFRPVLLRAKAAKPDIVAHLGYGPDGGLLVKQLRSLGFEGTFLGGQSTKQYLQIAGRAAEGTLLAENFTLNDPSAAVQKFVKAFRAKFTSDPGSFNAYAYDALHVVTQAAQRGGATREGVYKGLASGKPFDTIQFGKLTFNDKRRPNNVALKKLQVVNGAFQIKGIVE